MVIDEVENISYPEDNLVLMAPAHVVGSLVNTGDSILLKGKIDTIVKLSCARCLKEYNHPLKFDIEEEYSTTPLRVLEEKKDVELTEKDFIFEVEKNNTINLSEAIRQNILTQLPIMPLCNKLCEGGKIDASTKEATQ